MDKAHGLDWLRGKYDDINLKLSQSRARRDKAMRVTEAFLTGAGSSTVHHLKIDKCARRAL